MRLFRLSCPLAPRSDGAKIRYAVLAQRELKTLEAELGRPLTSAERHQMPMTKRLPDDLLRQRTSVAPPSRTA